MYSKPPPPFMPPPTVFLSVHDSFFTSLSSFCSKGSPPSLQLNIFLPCALTWPATAAA